MIVYQIVSHPFGQRHLKWATWKKEKGNVIKLYLKLFRLTKKIDTFFREVTGELFAHTSRTHPFNLLSNSSDNTIPREQYRAQRDKIEEDNQPNNTVLYRLKQKILKYVFYDMKFFN